MKKLTNTLLVGKKLKNSKIKNGTRKDTLVRPKNTKNMFVLSSLATYIGGCPVILLSMIGVIAIIVTGVIVTGVTGVIVIIVICPLILFGDFVCVVIVIITITISPMLVNLNRMIMMITAKTETLLQYRPDHVLIWGPKPR